MKRNFILNLSILSLLLLLFATVLEARGRRRMRYDTNSVITFTGKVTDIQKKDRRRRNRGYRNKGRGAMYRIKVQTENTEYSVHLGPTRYIDKQSVKINSGDTITVKGSKINRWGRTFVIAERIIKNSEVLLLRKPDGTPLWKRSRRNRHWKKKHYDNM